MFYMAACGHCASWPSLRYERIKSHLQSHGSRSVQTLYIYVGVALLVGVATGATLHYASAFLTGLMNLESQPEEEPRGRTVASYRARRTDKLQQQKTRPPMIPPIVTSPKIEGAFKDEFAKLRERDTQPRRSLLTSTILEEDDSSDERF